MLFILLSITAAFWMLVALDTYRGLRELPALESEPPLTSGGKVSVIIAARNEEDTIEKSVLSQLNTTYDPVEWILVNDRSTDRTGEIMENLALKDRRIQVIHISSLPAGWLGKNHALHTGAKRASGDLLLFTDADIQYEPDLLAKAVAYFKRMKLDHLTVSPDLQANSFLLQGFIAFFLFGFSYYKRPWSANRDHSKSGMGIGAFNMISPDAYAKIGGHKAIRSRPDDDLQLGMQIKRKRLRQRMATARKMLRVEWYPSLQEAIKGLEKNAFAGLHYSYLFVFAAMTGVFISQLLPFVALFFAEGSTLLMSWIAIGAIMSVYIPLTARLTNFNGWHALIFPVSVSLFIYAILRAAVLTAVRGGVQWRGTLYPLKELKKRTR
ncbi:glycosyltransferase [Jeotgalibacillus aurantiacus]|uniref:glycosyltransferase n=1 Tax=Jeotgalibacillus aurantiacus TaxID=2763266 RepID=UPI001D0A3922|nr:glycosyltransferase [Jeotgalibacillus aurantiacus]